MTTNSQIKRAFVLTALFIGVFVFAGADNDARFNDLGHRLICVCGCNQILLECNHVGCQYSTRMRGELAAAIERGENDDLTMQAMVQSYGPTVVAAPAGTGFDRVAWIMPYLALVLGLTVVTLVVRAWRLRPEPPGPGNAPAVSPAELDEFRDQARRETGL
jgi:cytochrome c-type biogenesis protein CcmH